MNLNVQRKNRMLAESLKRILQHLEDLGGPIEDNSRMVDDYHCARQLVGRSDDGWDKAAAERGFREAKFTVLGVPS